MEMALNEHEIALVLAERKRIAKAEAAARALREKYVLRRDGNLRVEVYSGQGTHHPTYAVYDGEELVCVCVYKRGAFALADYIKRRLAQPAQGGATEKEVA